MAANDFVSTTVRKTWFSRLLRTWFPQIFGDLSLHGFKRDINSNALKDDQVLAAVNTTWFRPLIFCCFCIVCLFLCQQKTELEKERRRAEGGREREGAEGGGLGEQRGGRRSQEEGEAEEGRRGGTGIRSKQQHEHKNIFRRVIYMYIIRIYICCISKCIFVERERQKVERVIESDSNS